MSAISLILLATAVSATAVGGAALHTARDLRHQLGALRAQLDAADACDVGTGDADASDGSGSTAAVPHARTAAVPHARTAASAEEIRVVVVEALAEERERELAEARAFWAAQDARDNGTDGSALLAGHGTEYEIASAPYGLDPALFDALLEGRVDDETRKILRDLRDRDVPEGGVFVPRQYSCDTEPGLNTGADAAAPEETGANANSDAGADAATNADAASDHAAEREHTPELGPEGPESPGLTAARRRHPSQPDFTLNGEPAVPAQAQSSAPAVADHERTVGRLAELADARTALADVRQGPLGTLDVYLFEDGTTVCLSPGHRETAERLSAALRSGEAPFLMGGSSVSGAYALTFAYGEGRTAYLLADRVIASN